jgi:hypothetical protein
LVVPATVFRFLATATCRIARDVASAIEGLDAILLTLIDVAKEQSTEDAQFLQMMTSEEGNGN